MGLRFKLILLLGVVAAVVFSVNRIYVTLTNRHPTTMTCADFVAGRFSAKWVVLTDCELDLDHAIGLQSRILKVDKGTYVPVRPAGVPGAAPLLLKTDDADPLKGITDRRDADPVSPSPRVGVQSAAAVATVSGLVESSLEANSKERRALDKVARDGTLRDDYIVIAAGKQPDPGEAVLFWPSSHWRSASPTAAGESTPPSRPPA